MNCKGCEFFKHTHSNEHCYRYFQETSLCKLRQPVEQPSTSEFLKGCRDLRKKGVSDEQWEYATKLGEACDIIKELLTACEELVKFCYPDGKWRGWDNMEGILEIMQPIRRLANDNQMV